MLPTPRGKSLGAEPRSRIVAGSHEDAGRLDQFLINSGNPSNDEFAVGPSIDPKWNFAGSTQPTLVDVNLTRPGNLFLRRNDLDSVLTAYHQPLPSVLPCDITLKITSDTMAGNFTRGGGIVLLPAALGTAVYFGLVYDTVNHSPGPRGVAVINYSSFPAGTFASYSAYFENVTVAPVWLRVVVRAGGAAADFYYSQHASMGWVLLLSNNNIGATITKAVHAGIAMGPDSQAIDCLSTFEYYRVS